MKPFITLMAFSLFMILVWSCLTNDRTRTFTVKHYKSNDEKIAITGRVLEGDSVTMFWPATSVKVRFRGTVLKAQLRDEYGKNYFNIVIDGDSIRHIRLDSVKQFYTLANGLPDGEHTVELIKRTEWDKGKSWFYGMQVMDGELIKLPAPNKRVIEFYGNSITAGYAIDDNTGGDSPDSTFTNNYYTYAAITARHFNADYYATVRSGIGITVSWFPLVMPELYNRLDPADSLSRWDFTKVTPQVVVINLLQNDSWLVNRPDHPSFAQRFGHKAPSTNEIKKAYSDFVRMIRKEYPAAHIICALGSMDATRKGSPWPGYLRDAVRGLNDKNVHALVFPYTGKNGHPRRADNEVMARQLIEYIEKNISW
jgi:hypothetical protein